MTGPDIEIAGEPRLQHAAEVTLEAVGVSDGHLAILQDRIVASL